MTFCTPSENLPKGMSNLPRRVQNRNFLKSIFVAPPPSAVQDADETEPAVASSADRSVSIQTPSLRLPIKAQASNLYKLQLCHRATTNQSRPSQANNQHPLCRTLLENYGFDSGPRNTPNRRQKEHQRLISSSYVKEQFVQLCAVCAHF